MLKFEAHKNLKNIHKGECNRIAIYADTGELVAFVIAVGDGYLMSTRGAPDFDRLASDYGITKATLDVNNQPFKLTDKI